MGRAAPGRRSPQALRPDAVIANRLAAMTVALMGLAACERGSSAATVGATGFWMLAIHQEGAEDRSLVICADEPVLHVFMRSLPEVDGTPCRLDDRQLALMTFCTNGRRRYAIHSATGGDPDDFTVDTVIVSEPERARRFERRLHFLRRSSRCPDGWTQGEIGVLGERSVLNVLSGKTRVLSETMQAF